MMAVVTWRVEAPRRINSAASSQVSMPPIPETGSCSSPAADRICCRKRRAIGLTDFPDSPETADLPLIFGRATLLSRSTSVIDLTVLMEEIPSAPPARQALTTGIIVVMFGVILAKMGRSVPRLTAAQLLLHNSGLV